MWLEKLYRFDLKIKTSRNKHTHLVFLSFMSLNTRGFSLLTLFMLKILIAGKCSLTSLLTLKTHTN